MSNWARASVTGLPSLPSSSRRVRSMIQSPKAIELWLRAALRSIERRRSTLRAREQVAQIDRLGDVVVARDLEAEDAIDVGVAAGDEDDARVAGRLDLLGEIETVAVGQLHVEEDEIGPRPQRLAAFRAGAGADHVEIVLAEIADQHRPRHRIVLDDDQPLAASDTQFLDCGISHDVGCPVCLRADLEAQVAERAVL